MLPESRLVPPVRRPRIALAVGALVGAVVLGGCGAGQVAQTAYQANGSTGATVTVNGIAIRDAQIAFGDDVEGAAIHPRGGTAPVEMHVINQGTQGDRLVSATSPVAASVTVGGQTDLPAGVEMVVSGGANASGRTLPGASEGPPEPPIGDTLAPASPGAPPTAETPEESAETSPTGLNEPSGEAPAAGLDTAPPIAEVVPSTRFAQVVLTGLNDDIKAGLSYEIDLTFERAGVVRVSLPVGYPGQPRQPVEKAE